MWSVKIIALLLLSLHFSDGCQMDGVATWFVPVVTQVVDVQRGVFFSRSTTNILRIESITNGEGLRGGPYVEAAYEDLNFTLSTNNAYPQYEENEVSSTMTLTIVFGCTGGSTATLVFQIDVTDTNNNAPETSSPQFTLTPPLPPGFQITGCLGDIIARDIDLTTRRVDFEIEDNPYFMIEYDEASTIAQTKAFRASLKTTTLIRSIPEPIELTIAATDVDDTGDPPITTYSVIRIEGNNEFQLPEEPIFSKPFYLGNYTADQVELEVISLQHGFHETVRFGFESVFAEHFELVVNGNALSLTITSPLSPDTFGLGQIILVITAEREYTSGATTTVILQLPQATQLAFEQASYEGNIIDNVLSPLQLVLSQGSQEDGLNVSLNEHSSFFTTTLQGNIITLTMTPLDQNIINENNFINLLVTATNGHSAATAVVTLEIVKDDVITPVFERAIYTGQYDTLTGLDLEQITLVQGYDDTVIFSLNEEHATYFEFNQTGPNVTLIVNSLPLNIFAEKYILLTILASKPRTVGANAVISIELPSARELKFESNIYIGSMQEDILILEYIALSTGFNDDVIFYLEGDYASYFNTSNIQNLVTLNLTTPLPANVLADNNYITFTLFASGEYTTVASTSVFLSISKQDDSTPVFSQNIYLGTYSEGALTIEDLFLLQGHDDSVTFSLEGANSDYFSMDIISSNISLVLKSEIPVQLIYDEKVLLFYIKAEKPLSVSASAVVAITFPRDLTDPTLVLFERNTYIGSLNNTVLNLENITLHTGYTIETEFILRGDLAEYFHITNSINVVTVSIANTIPANMLGENKYIVLELYAERNQTVSVPASIIIDIVEQEGETLIFEEPYYKGSYSGEFGLQFDYNISLLQGYDDTVVFALEEVYSDLFTLYQNGNSISIALNQSIGDEILRETNYFVFTIAAYRNGEVPAKAAVIIDFPEGTQDIIIVGFTQNSYVGSIDSGELHPLSVTLLDGTPEATTFNLTGNFSSYFEIRKLSNNVEILLVNQLPNDIESSFIILELEASYTGSINGYTTIVLEIIKESFGATLVFEQPYYVGEYSEQNGLLFEHNIRLIEGFDESVLFTLSGVDSRWFNLVTTNDSLSLNLTEEAINVEDKRYLVFSIVASKTNSVNGQTAIVIALQDVRSSDYLQFSQTYYKGLYEDNQLTMEEIRLETSYTTVPNVTFTGDYSEYFQLTSVNGTYTLEIDSELPPEVTENNVLIFTLEARNGTETTYATLVIELKAENNVTRALEFDKTYYLGSYSEETNFVFDEEILLSSGYDDSVVFSLDGEFNELFELSATENVIRLLLVSPIPQEVILNTQYLLLTINAQKLGSPSASSVIIISLKDDLRNEMTLRFEKTFYLGKIENNTATIEPITLIEGYSVNVTFELTGELSEYLYFTVEEDQVFIYLSSPIPVDLQPGNGILILDLEALAPNAVPAHTAVIFELVHNITEVEVEQLLFAETYYIGNYTEADGLNFNETITLVTGFDDTVEFGLDGDDSIYFILSIMNNSVTLIQSSSIPSAVFINNPFLIFTVTAHKPESITARTTIVITLTGEFEGDRILSFNRISYTGSMENNSFNLEPIILSEGYESDVTFSLNGELMNYFNIDAEAEMIAISLQDSIPEEIVNTQRVIVLELQASAPQTMSAFATVVLEVIKVEVEIEQLEFNHPYYTGVYNRLEGLVMENFIALSHGYDEDVGFHLDGDNSVLFELNVNGNSVSLSLNGSTIPENILNTYLKLIFVIIAEKPDVQPARATIVISLLNDEQNDTGPSFEKNLYQGVIQAGLVQHETIVISGYNGTDVHIEGEYSELFEVSALAGSVVVVGIGSVTLAKDVNYAAFELRVANTSAVLILDVIHSDTPALPTVLFSSPSYIFRVEISQTGKIGQVEATADNGEQVSYSLQVQNEHLLQRLFVDEEGDVHLSAPANSGVYTFQVTATTIFTQTTGAAQVHLTVDAITSCGEDDYVVPPLIIVERDEEEPQRDLVTLSEDLHGCWFNMSNRWPTDQTWLYVDETGLHTTPIDREHESIAFMALSQVQVELILICDTDHDPTEYIDILNTESVKQITPTNIQPKLDSLGPYDYGDNNWVITDTILFNPRRTFVNLIVNDINDNYPIFEGKQNEPIVVGYPVLELEAKVLPRSLIALKATDADVGENASLVYWTSEDILAVSPTTGLVHVRDGSTLTDGTSLTVYATDRDGEGLTGSLDLLVKMLDVSHIAVVTVSGAFLDDEETILRDLSAAVGYEVKALRSTVIADSEAEVRAIRRKRQTSTPAATLQIYVYGLVDTEPVDVDQLAADITDSAVSTLTVVSTISLEDHLDNTEICGTGLLVATIVLSVLLFMLIVAAAVCFILLWRKKHNYDQFSDENSLASRNKSLEQLPKPNPADRPRLNIEELRRSEKRLQEMLDAPIEENMPSSSEVPSETVNVSIPDQPSPIVIQSIDKLAGGSDDEDEYGERMKAKRKSVVTFNENVEKIIHVDDSSDNDDNDFEIYKF